MYCKSNRRWRWSNATPVPATDPLHSLLTDQGSLTRRLCMICKEFQVVLHRSRFGKVCPDETFLLSAGNGEMTMVREVSLVCDGVPLVFGHSILMTRKLGVLARLFRRVENNSLGSILFAYPDIRRAPIYFKRIDRKHPLYSKCAAAFGDSAKQFFWARRSVFSLHSEQVCVTEVFSPQLMKICQNHRMNPPL